MIRRKHYPLIQLRPVASLAFVYAAGLALCCGFIIQVTTNVQAQGVADKTEKIQVIPGNTYERRISEDSTHVLQVDLSTGQFLQMEFRAVTTELLVTVFRPQGERLLEYSSRDFGTTPLYLVAQESGLYSIRVRIKNKYQHYGTYSLKVNQIQPASRTHKESAALATVYAEGRRLREKDTNESLAQALTKFKEAEFGWRRLRNANELAVTLTSIGELDYRLGDYSEALQYLERALTLRREIHGSEIEAALLNQQGYTLLGLGENDRALESCVEALALFRQLGNKRGVAEAFSNLGEVYYGLSQLEHSLEAYNSALPIFEELHALRGQAQTHLNYGTTYSLLRDVSQSVYHLQKALTLWREVDDKRGEATTLAMLGVELTRTGEWQRAMELYDKALAFFESTQDVYGRALVYNCIGYLQVEAGRRAEALRLYNLALPLLLTLGNREAVAGTLLNIGQIHLDYGEAAKALDYFQRSLELARKLRDPLMQGYAILDIGRAHEALSQDDLARRDYEEALTFFRKGGDRLWEARSLNSIASIYARAGELKKALDYLAMALPLAKDINNPRETSLTLYNVAAILRRQSRLTEARTNIEEALKLSETLRVKASTQDLRTAYFATVHKQFEFYIDLLMTLGRQEQKENLDSLALVVSERARARSLVDTLVESRVDIREGVDEKLLARERELQKLLSEEADRKIRARALGQNSTALNEIEKRIETFTAEYQQVQGQIRYSSARYASLLQPQPLRSDEIKQLLDPNTLLLEYCLGEERSFLWAVTNQQVNSFVLPGRNEIEKQAREVYDSLTARNLEPAGETTLQRAERIQRADRRFNETGERLTKTILGPLGSLLSGQRLVIVADGALQYVPFASLPDPARKQPLLANHEVVNLPSASVLFIQRRELANRTSAKNAVAIIADPVFDRRDLRLAEAKTDYQQVSHNGGMRTRNRSLKKPLALDDTDSSIRTLRALSTKRGGILRLPYSRQEAESIFDLAPQSSALKALDFKASRATVVDPELSNYRIIHFATHGLLDNEHPDLSGILLSLVDEKGRPQNGFLQLHEIYNLNLPADLVVLSACQTAIGKDVKGEGLMSLTRGFMHAGAARVVASLWKVDDAATSDLMSLFYKEMFVNHAKPAAALRSAQLELSKRKRYESPYYWAGFTLQGEWK